MKEFIFKPRGVCSTQIRFSIDENKLVHNVHFTNGCSGNSQGVSALSEGMEVNELIKRLKGTNCGGRGTSCPDQFACALEKANIAIEQGNENI